MRAHSRPRPASDCLALGRRALACPCGSGVSRTQGRSSKRGSERNTAQPSSPSSPSPTFAWRSRLEPSGVCESLKCSEPSRSRPTSASHSSSAASRPSRGAHVVARGEQVAGVQAQAEPLVAAGRVDQRGQLGERAPERPARARGVLQVQRAALGLGERLARSPRRRARSPGRRRRSSPSPGAAPRRPRRARRRRSARRRARSASWRGSPRPRTRS